MFGFTNTENRLGVAKGESGGGGMGWEFGISRCKLLYREWIDNKVLLYSTENYIQCPMMNHNGKGYIKKHVHTYNNHFAVQQKLTHCKSTIIQLKKKKKSFKETLPEIHQTS